MKKTVKQLDEELQQLKHDAGNVQLAQMTCWKWEQIAVDIEEYDRYGEMIKLEVTKDWAIGKRCYHVYIWHRLLLNEEARREQNRKGDVYQALRDTKEHI